MAYATLMLYVDADGMPEQRVRLAANLADKFTARLIGFSALAIRPPLVAEGVVIAASDGSRHQGDEERSSPTKETGFANIAGADHRKLEWRSALDFPTDALAREARSADLIVIGRSKGPGDAYSSLDLGGAILKIGRPVLVVPEGVGSLRAEHVVIGWKDTREARRAVQDALPFLHEASSVTIVEICESDEDDVAQEHIDDVAHYLGRHRIKAGPKIIFVAKDQMQRS